jgi:HlyD family secretion protein
MADKQNLSASIQPRLAQAGTLIRKRKFWYIAVPVIVILIAAGSYAYLQAAQKKSQAASQSTTQTAVVRLGNIEISASGTGSLIAASQAEFGFQTSGKLAELSVKIGDQVKKGQLLAQLDNSTQQAELDSANQSLAELTSPAAIATAKQAAAQAQLDVNDAYSTLAYQISPEVLSWEEKVTAAQQTLDKAQIDAQASPSAQTDQKVQEAQAALKSAQQELGGAKAWYEKVYLPDHFTVTEVDKKTHTVKTYISAPSATNIEDARTALDLARANLVEAQDLVTALTQGYAPKNATGSSLSQLVQARLDVQNAQDNLDATRLFSPLDGTVTAINAQVGDSVSDTTTVITVADLSRSYLDIYIDESDWEKLAIGEETDVIFDALPTQTFTGHVTSIDPVLTSVDNVPAVHAQVELDSNTDSSGRTLLIGLNASVDVISAKADNVLLVPVEALQELETGKYAVFVQQSDGQLKLQTVEIGLMDDSYAEVKSGLQEGDVVSTGIAATGQGSSSGNGTGGGNNQNFPPQDFIPLG